MSTGPLTVGRPPSLAEEERKALILQAAERVFDALGYGDATMEEVARACGMAKKTLYKFFPDKAALFGALIDSHDILTVSEARPAGEVRGLSEGGDRASRLRRLLEELAAFILSPRQLTLTRLVIAEATKSPELAERFYRECVEKTQGYVVRELEADFPGFADNIDQARVIADVFVGSTLGTVHIRALMLNADHAALKKELSVRLDMATGMMERFLAG